MCFLAVAGARARCEMAVDFSSCLSGQVLGYYGTPVDLSRVLAQLARGDQNVTSRAGHGEQSVGQGVSALNGAPRWVHSWPLVIKSCHLTQGEMRSVRLVRNRSALTQTLPALRCWLRRMYGLRADDKGRVWREQSNALTLTASRQGSSCSPLCPCGMGCPRAAAQVRGRSNASQQPTVDHPPRCLLCARCPHSIHSTRTIASHVLYAHTLHAPPPHIPRARSIVVPRSAVRSDVIEVKVEVLYGRAYLGARASDMASGSAPIRIRTHQDPRPSGSAPIRIRAHIRIRTHQDPHPSGSAPIWASCRLC